MRYEIELMEHNGVTGRNPVEPFEGRVFRKDELFFPDFSEEEIRNEIIRVERRNFTYSHTVNLPDQRNYVFRERVKGEPSEWAKARANA